MKTMKRAYYYLFYKLYKWYEKGPSVWWSDWKAGISIIALEIWLVASLFIYYKIFFNRYAHLSDSGWELIICALLIIIPNYWVFVHTDKWKDYVQEFDQLPKRTNKIGGWIVFGVVLLIIANLVFAFYQMSLIDWSKYR